jgi:osmoprotectant transport system ATP-binding protein
MGREGWDNARGVIDFDRVTKIYPGASLPAVRDLTLRIAAGTICALVGPSGSGKTTVMRMINRLHEPTSGQIRIDGVDNLSIPAEQLRRSIGYVIQQVGLFPHRTIADNIATVPRLLEWDEGRIRARTSELLTLVGLEPNVYAQRFPAQLSGGQRQRVGVARALAADPPVLLMDEPFGAIDPVVRTQIQDEFLRLQQVVRKTIVIVTHDIDEAVRMGDTVAVLREGGILEQHGPPRELLARPASPFVAEFLGADSGLKRLSLLRVREMQLLDLQAAAMQGWSLHCDATGRPACWSNGRPATPVLTLETNLRDALSELMLAGAYVAPVVDEHGQAVAVATTDAIQQVLLYDVIPPATSTDPPAQAM